MTNLVYSTRASVSMPVNVVKLTKKMPSADIAIRSRWISFLRAERFGCALNLLVSNLDDVW